VSESIHRLLDVMARLRDPLGGCPWDLEQTWASVAPHTIEEAYEVEDAVRRGDPGLVRDELGDLLFQVVFQARIAEERGLFAFDDVADAIAGKLERRHPHVFGTEVMRDAEEQSLAWERHKASERAERGGEGGALAGVPLALPALSRAAKLGRRAAGVGFDWPDAAGVLAKVGEEIDELTGALREGTPEQVQEEIGDLLFTVAQFARHRRIDPEAALRDASAKFERRFRSMESRAAARGLELTGLALDALEELWVEAKRESG
jgi:ATP diphosphatase